MNFDNEKIFVSIASYRDPDIQNTIDISDYKNVL